MSDSVRPHRQQPMRLPHPWDSPGKNTGVGCHFHLQCMKGKSESEVAQSCPTLSDPMDYSPPGPPSMGFSRQEYWSGVVKITHVIAVGSMVVLLNRVWLFVTPWTVATIQAPLSMGFSRQEYWNGFPFPTPGDLSDPEIEPKSPASPALQADSSPRRYLLLVHLEWTIMLEIMGSTLCLSFYFVGWRKPQWHHASRQWHWDWIAVVGQEKWTY